LNILWKARPFNADEWNVRCHERPDSGLSSETR
jgi:hypothetical protein